MVGLTPFRYTQLEQRSHLLRWWSCTVQLKSWKHSWARHHCQLAGSQEGEALSWMKKQNDKKKKEESFSTTIEVLCTGTGLIDNSVCNLQVVSWPENRRNFATPKLPSTVAFMGLEGKEPSSYSSTHMHSSQWIKKGYFYFQIYNRVFFTCLTT